MAAGTPIEIACAKSPQGGVRVLAVPAPAWGRLRAEGAAADSAAPSSWPPSLLSKEEAAALRELAAFTRFEAKPGQLLPWRIDSQRLGALVGLGGGGSRRAALRSSAAAAAQSLADGADWTLDLRAIEGDAAARADHLAAAAEGVLLSTYSCKRTARKASERRRGRCTLIADLDDGPASQALARARAAAAGVVLTRDLVNAPAAELGPDELADAAVALAQRHGFESEVLRRDEVVRRGFRMVAAVGRGSARPPTVTVLRRGDVRSQGALALIGKGVVFDSGGLDLKPSEGMLLMRKDMGGAATILGALEAAAQLGVELPLLVVIPSAENMVGPDCYRPGDILTAYDGTTVEIGNTDAEGRLLLADAIGYAREQGSPRLLDVATLTGAARVALGPDVPALFGTDEAMVALLERESAAADERMWRMPLVDDYDRQLDTPFADVNHVSHDKRAGAITAALFLRRFAGATPWSHVDLYAWEDGGRPDTPKGANGMGVRTLACVLGHLGAVAARGFGQAISAHDEG